MIKHSPALKSSLFDSINGNTPILRPLKIRFQVLSFREKLIPSALVHPMTFLNLPSVKDAFLIEQKPIDFVKVGGAFYRVIGDETIPRRKDIIAHLQSVGLERNRRYFESNIGRGLIATFDNKYLKIKVSSIM